MSELNTQMSSGDDLISTKNKNAETFAETIENPEKNNERKIGNGNSDEKSEVSKSSENPQVVVSIPSDDAKSTKPNLVKSGSENSFAGGITLTPGLDFRPPRNNVETGYLVKNPTKSNLKSHDEPKKMQETKKEEFGPGHGVKMSSMEEEAMRERLRMTLLKQCSDYLSADGSSRYTKETFRRVFTEKVRGNYALLSEFK